MLTSADLVSLTLIFILSAMLIISGLKKQPGIGIIGAVVLIAVTLWWRGDGLGTLGFGPPSNWGRTILLGLLYGILIQLLSITFIEPISEKLTNTTHDHSIIEGVKGSWKALLQWLVIVWVLVAFLEEGIYRGFLMTEVANIGGVGALSLWLNVLLTAVVFGLSHGYQNRCGILSTGTIGLLLGWIFIQSDFNVWLPLFVHGFVDTIGIGLIAVDGDKMIRQMIWGGTE